MATLANSVIATADGNGSAPGVGQNIESLSAMTKPDASGPLTEFTLFPKLPIELRIIIWGLAAPEPAYVTQVLSKSIKRRLHYIHTIPAVLQVCQESRNEFLAADPNDQTLPGQQRGHPVYTFHTSGGRTRNDGRGFYISTEIDTFWRLQGENIGNLSIAWKLKHLAIMHCYLDQQYLKRLNTIFPALETLTLILSISRYISMRYYATGITFEKEIDGAVNPLMFGGKHPGLDFLSWQQRESLSKIEQLKKDHPKLKVPIIKWRIEQQVIEVENIVFPKSPKNPYEEIDREEEAVEKQRKKAKKDKKIMARLSASKDI